jgi:excisionase family DNA binding protein
MTDLQLLTCEEVARLLRISQETVRNLAASGELPGRKIGRAWRFPRAAVENQLRGAAAKNPLGGNDIEKRNLDSAVVCENERT